ncbi:MAG: hypothetical protein AB7E73_05270 [Burkholderiales bacterium]
MRSAATTWILRCGAAFTLALCVAAPVTADDAGTARFDNLVRSPYVHCAFYRQYDVDPKTGDLLLVEGRSDSLTHFQRQRGGRVIAIDTRRSGALDAQLLHGRKYLHYIERNAGMYVVTTIYACLERDVRTDTCINYGAVNARHFDSRVLSDPDAVFEALHARAKPGFCDHSFLNVQEAARRPEPSLQ